MLKPDVVRAILSIHHVIIAFLHIFACCLNFSFRRHSESALPIVFRLLCGALALYPFVVLPDTVVIASKSSVLRISIRREPLLSEMHCDDRLYD